MCGLCGPPLLSRSFIIHERDDGLVGHGKDKLPCAKREGCRLEEYISVFAASWHKLGPQVYQILATASRRGGDTTDSG